MFKLQIYFVSIILLVFPPSITHGQQTISYGDYSIETKFPANGSRPYFTIKRGRHLLSKHSGLIASDIGMKIELVDLLHAQSKQLLLRMYTGGNHCCDIIRIYDLGPRLRLLFRSSDYDLNDREGLRYFEVKQLDNDAPLELVAESYAFAYFDNLPWVSSPMPEIIFDYNAGTRKFTIANRRFSKYLLRDVDEWKSETMKIRDVDRNQYRVSMFSIFVRLAYAGRKERAMQLYFEDHYLKRFHLTHNRVLIQTALNNDAAYRAIYRK